MEPGRDCPLCPRLVEHRQALRLRQPDWHNAPVGAFGDAGAWLAIVGLAPGERGANRTGRPFTGDFAGDLLYTTLAEAGLTQGAYAGTPDDGLALVGTRIVNAVRCLPPHNKPEPLEIRTCRPFLEADLKDMPNLKVVLALGQVAHQSAVKALGGKLPKHPFAHGTVHRLHTGYTLVDSYHCSRYNQNTGRLTAEMFREAVQAALNERLSPVETTPGGRLSA
ncbi:uracil-DNA glycosylase [Sandaracinobacter sp. RS1-74]|uniref:uracil-DNA glycosylase n=1 Tax=Sandaracinobacteroides sayramensis TaxID=2913411 RepID=UPI001EDC459B|nr:uracil-DNA glycosylase [Sandaracinobacteroides sayramensis]MCG2839838.1 uracil-DNA glycosylase [Sandaracinobacteroides sayramensis]